MNWIPNTEGYYFKRYLRLQEIFKDNNRDKEVFIKENVDLLSKCIDPGFFDDQENNQSTGIAIGYIQSGKTSSMEAIANLARDNGFKLIIVLSGTVGNLTTQTQERLFRTMKGIGWKRIYIPEARRTFNKIKLAQDMQVALSTWDNKHFNKNEKRSIAIVTMKSTYRINKLFDLLKILKSEFNISLTSVPTLIIDDECDHYSLNSLYNEENIGQRNNEEEYSDRRTFTGPEYYTIQNQDTVESICNEFNIAVEELYRLNRSQDFSAGERIIIYGNESATHRRLKQLRSLFNHHTYLGYTATPYASLLISTFNHLSPNFGTILTPGSKYTGAETFFKDRRNQPNIEVFNRREIDELSDRGLMPRSLKKAIRFFLIGVAIGIHDENKDHLKMKSRSMIVHSTAQTGAAAHRNEHIPLFLCHEYFYNLINDYINSLKDIFSKRDGQEFKEEIDEFELCHSNLLEKSSGADTVLNFDSHLTDLIEKSLYFTEVIEFNARENETIPNIEWGEEGYARILVGGHGIERGYTVEGLTVSYMSRNPSLSIDTSMQRARFFGYHKDYTDLIRIFVTVNNNELYQDCFITEINMRKSIQDHLKNNKSLKSWPRFFLSDRNQQYLPTRRSILGFELHRNKRNIQISLDSMAHDLDEDIINRNRKIYSIIVNNPEIKPIKELYNTQSNREWLQRRDDLIIENTTLRLILKLLQKIEHHDYNLMQFYSVRQLIEQYLDDNDDIQCPIIVMNSKEDNEVRPFRTMLPNTSINLHGGGRGEEDRLNNPNLYPGDNFMQYEFIISDSLRGNNNDQFPKTIPTLQVYFIDVILHDKLKNHPISQRCKLIKEETNSRNHLKPYIEKIPCFNFFTPESVWRNITYGTHM